MIVVRNLLFLFLGGCLVWEQQAKVVGTFGEETDVLIHQVLPLHSLPVCL